MQALRTIHAPRKAFETYRGPLKRYLRMRLIFLLYAVETKAAKSAVDTQAPLTRVPTPGPSILETKHAREADNKPTQYFPFCKLNTFRT